MNFDVITEPCVPVRMLTGEFLELSIRDVIKNAHLIDSIYTPSIFEEYGLKRLLCVFIIDMYRPETNDDLVRILNEHNFDINIFDSYVLKCTQNGLKDVFNLFSDKYPFLQTAYDEVYDEGESKLHINSLFYDLPSSTNHTFYYKEYKISAKDCFRALCSLNLFLFGMGGSGVATCLSGGDPPYYYWIKGNSFFHELILNSVSMEDWNKLTQGVFSYVGGTGENVAWRRESPLKIEYFISEKNKKTKKKFTSLSLLEGLTYMSKRIRLEIPDSIDDVKHVYCKNGSGFLDEDGIWRDIHCAYMRNEKKSTKQDSNEEDKEESKKKFIVHRPVKDDEILCWLHLKPLYQFNELKPPTFIKFTNYGAQTSYLELEENLNKFGLSMLQVISYAGYNEKGCYKWWGKFDIDINIKIFSNENLVNKYLESLNLVSNIQKCINSSLLKGQMDYKYYYQSMKDYISNIYMDGLCDVLSGSKSYDEVIDALKGQLIKCAVETYELNFKNKDLYKPNILSLKEEKSKNVTSYNISMVNYVKDLNYMKKNINRILSKV